MRAEEIIQPLEERLLGRTTVGVLKDPLTKELIVKRNQEIDEELTHKIIDAGIDRIKIRSVLPCQTKFEPRCTKCYGRDLGRGEQVEKVSPSES